MKKVLVVVLLLGILVVSLHFYSKSGEPRPTKDSRTVYDGYVDIESLSAEDLMERLEKQGCRPFDVDEAHNPGCRFHRTIDEPPEKEGVQIFPHGPGFGPVSFIVTETRLWTWEDIAGPPDEEKFKTAVREDVMAIGNIISLRENSWKLLRVDYPVDYVY